MHTNVHSQPNDISDLSRSLFHKDIKDPLVCIHLLLQQTTARLSTAEDCCLTALNRVFLMLLSTN